jgi:hypothetical protein
MQRSTSRQVHMEAKGVTVIKQQLLEIRKYCYHCLILSENWETFSFPNYSRVGNK